MGDANRASCSLFLKSRQIASPLSRYIVTKAHKHLIQPDQREHSTKMHLTKSFKLPQPYILAAILCSFGGFLFGYFRLSFPQLTFREMKQLT